MQFRDVGGSSADAPLCPKLAYATCDSHAGEGPAPCAVVPVRESMPPVQLLARSLVQSRLGSDLNLQRLMAEFEELLIDAVLESMPSLRAAARALGISRSTLWRRLRRRDGSCREKRSALFFSDADDACGDYEGLTIDGDEPE
jgi:hypothetical protein